jgi:hypothetical protein
MNDEGPTFSDSEKGGIDVSINRLRKYYPTPVYVPPVINYYDEERNKAIRKQMTYFFLDKLINWTKSESKLKKYNKFIKSKEGLLYVYHLLTMFVENSSSDWYNLTDSINYPNVKAFLKYKLQNSKF